MTYSLLLRPEAQADLGKAYHWYEQRHEGLGNDFLLCVEEGLDRIRRTPELYPLVPQGTTSHVDSSFPLRVVLSRERRDDCCRGGVSRKS